MEQKYKSEISVKRWIVYDIFGNAGWIMYFICAGLLLKSGATLIVLIPAILMLVGIIELISERVVKLDYVLPKKRLYRGFGALTLGGISGTIISGISFGIVGNRLFLWMTIGGVLCGVFAGLLFREYHPVEE